MDSKGTLKAIKELQRVLKSAGHLLVSVPIGAIDQVIFNAHRVFSPQSFINLFVECDLVEYSVALPDKLVRNVDFTEFLDHQDVFGLFHFQKK
jgi:hypothetical protein